MNRVIRLTDLPVCRFCRFRSTIEPPDISTAEGLMLVYKKHGWILPFGNAPPEIIARRGGPWNIAGGTGLHDLTIAGSIGGPPPMHFIIKDGWIEE